MDILRYISENLDAGVAFGWACGRNLCRSCPLSVNGKPALPCTVRAEENMAIETHPKFKVIEDLVVDLGHPK